MAVRRGSATLEVGKRVGAALYVHREAASWLAPELLERLETAIRLAGEITWNVAKIVRGGASLLLYEDFDEVAFPALLRSTAVVLEGRKAKSLDYTASANPPILHRKELLLAPNDPRRPTFAALTRAAEEHGLFRQPNRIGTRRAWAKLIEDAGLELRGHVLVPKGAPVVEVARHKTALSRRDLSQPVSLMLRWGVIERDSSVFDYGCGQGDDVAILSANGIEAFGWDPHHAPTGPRRPADAVNLGFVLNVIEDPNERVETLKAAWSFARRALTVAVMLPGQTPPTAQRPYRDGFLTARGTFQRYFAHEEIKTFVEGALGERCITLSPGIITAFRDKELEQEVSYRRRSRAALIAEGFVVPPRLPRPVTVAPSVRERIQPELEDIWRTALALGRPPEAGEVESDVRQALATARVSLERAIALACDGTFDANLLEEAALARREDLLVHFALSLFPGAPRYTKLARSLQRDVKTFFRSHAAAMEEARRMLFSAGDKLAIRAAAETAVAAGLGGFLGDAFVFTPSVLARLPPSLRVLHGCAEILHDDLNSAHFLQLPLDAPALTAITCDDPSRHFPAVRSRVEIDLQALRARRRGRAGSVLYMKSTYLAEVDPLRPAQAAIDQQLVSMGVVSSSGEGPLWEELQSALKAKA